MVIFVLDFYWQKLEPSKLVSIGCPVELTKELYFQLDQGRDWGGIDIGDGGDGGDDEDDDDDYYNGDNNGDDDDDADINFGDKEGGMCFTILKTNIDIELNSYLASRFRRMKQKKSSWDLAINNAFLLFYSHELRSQVWISILSKLFNSIKSGTVGLIVHDKTAQDTE